MKTKFGRVIDVGIRRLGQLWVGLTDGYKATREVSLGGAEHTVTCSITADKDTGVPIFQCQLDEVPMGIHRSTNATTVMKKALEPLGKFAGNLTGKKFFGLENAKVKVLVENAPEEVLELSNAAEEPSLEGEDSLTFYNSIFFDARSIF